MCIRDRVKIFDDRLEFAPVVFGNFAAEDRADLVGLANGATVSYTHLRAHETVLDLVCRLLLETKKD